MKYRKKPVVIEAIVWTGDNMFEVSDFMKYRGAFTHSSDTGLVIHTLEGDHKADIGDYIIKGVVGEYYPCKPDMFEQTYEKVEESTP